MSTVVTKDRKPNRLLGTIVKAIIVVSVIGCFISIISTQATLSEKQKELADIQQMVDEIKEENAEYERILMENDARPYMETRALEDKNAAYAYPNEIRFYDRSRTSRN